MPEPRFIFIPVNAKDQPIGLNFQFKSSGEACRWLDENFPTQPGDRKGPNQGYHFILIKIVEPMP